MRMPIMQTNGLFVYFQFFKETYLSCGSYRCNENRTHVDESLFLLSGRIVITCDKEL